MTACISTPISWLRLERFHGGDLEAVERQRVKEHLAQCNACASCAQRIRDEDARPLRPLRPLGQPRPIAPPAPAPAYVKAPAKVSRLRWAYALGPIAAAALVLMLVHGKKPQELEHAPPRTKGGEVAFTLVREDGTPFADERADFRAAGDRFRARVTCPAGALDDVDVVVFTDGQAVFPLPASRVACGNEVSLDGTFRAFGGADMRVCLLWNDPPRTVERAQVQDRGEKAVDHASCKTLRPLP